MSSCRLLFVECTDAWERDAHRVRAEWVHKGRQASRCIVTDFEDRARELKENVAKMHRKARRMSYSAPREHGNKIY